jgi:alkylation response protein AidB-like acyl-CoA dehydrogenase
MQNGPTGRTGRTGRTETAALLSEVQTEIRDLFADFFRRQSPTSVARAAEPLGFDKDLWQRLITTGATGMAVPEAAGGGGSTLSDLVVVAEELGRAIAPVPLLEHQVAARAHPDPTLVSGELIAGFAPRPADANGLWALVPGGAVADVVVGLDGDEFVAVASPAPGTGPANFGSSPLADRSARTGERVVLGDAEAFSRARDEWLVLLSAALTGIATSAMDIAVAYVNERHQFGVPIGSFQAVQQGLADLPGLIAGAQLLVHKAAWAADGGEQGTGTGALTDDVDDNAIHTPAALASMAFVFASDVAATATDRSLHYHGGYGFAEEYDIQLFYRRARGWPLAYSDQDRESLRLADQLF